MEYEIYTVIRTLEYSQHFKTFGDFRGLLIFRVLQVLKKFVHLTAHLQNISETRDQETNWKIK